MEVKMDKGGFTENYKGWNIFHYNTGQTVPVCYWILSKNNSSNIWLSGDKSLEEVRDYVDKMEGFENTKIVFNIKGEVNV